jgi:hypothetical protein
MGSRGGRLYKWYKNCDEKCTRKHTHKSENIPDVFDV